MINISTKVSNLNNIKEVLDKVNKVKFTDNIKFHRFYQKKVLEALEEVMNDRLGSHSTTNDEFISLYRASNHIENYAHSFVLYNDSVIDVQNEKIASNYPNGKFSIALAFEYGVGITGEGTYDGDYFKPWDYNVNNHNFGWIYKKQDGSYDTTYGYMGFEIYRYLVDKVNNELNDWYKEYLESE